MEGRSCELPSVVQFMRMVNGKNPQEAEDTHDSNMTISKQDIERRLSTQLKEIQALKHKQHLAYKSELSTMETYKFTNQSNMGTVTFAKSTATETRGRCKEHDIPTRVNS